MASLVCPCVAELRGRKGHTRLAERTVMSPQELSWGRVTPGKVASEGHSQGTVERREESH